MLTVRLLAPGGLSTSTPHSFINEAESTSIGLSAGEGGTGLSGIGVGRDYGSASSTIVSAISGLAGQQDARTGDAQTGIAPIYDVD